VKTDYTSFLRVSEDGHIWWTMQNALRLGAGYLPVSDEDRGVTCELRAPSDQAQVNERTLLGAFNDSRLRLKRPMTFVRDEVRYVDAIGFLEWLARYIEYTQTGEIAYPSEFETEVRLAMAKADASRQPDASQEFESLTFALEGMFDKKRSDLPETLRQRVEKEFVLLDWDKMTEKQRRNRADDFDYENDPATEHKRKNCLKFYNRLHNLQENLKKWESTATHSVSDFELKESRVKELQQEIHMMLRQKRYLRGDYHQERNNLDKNMTATSTQPADYIAYPKALNILKKKWKATPEDLAMWIFLGPEQNGLIAYLNANELSPPRLFSFAYFTGVEDYLSPLMACWFLRNDIDRFEPTDHYITGTALIERWSKQPGLQPNAFINAKIAESRLQDMHPTYGGTQGTFDDDVFPGIKFPSLSAGLFAMSQIEAIEAEDGFDVLAIQPVAEVVPVQSPPINVRREIQKKETAALHVSWQKAYKEVKRDNPTRPDVWIARKISKMPIAQGRNVETIRKNMKP